MNKKIWLFSLFLILFVFIISYSYKKETSDYEKEAIKEKLENTDAKENLDKGLFEEYYDKAKDKLKTLSLDEKIGQLLLVRYDENKALDDLKKYFFGGFIFFEKDFKNKTVIEVQEMISNLQNRANIPLLTAVDEEGGEVIRVSKNPKLSSPFKSPRELYLEGGMSLIKEDVLKKSKVLEELGLNLNLAPVVDISENPKDYIYKRTIGEGAYITKEYARSVIEASKNTKVSYTLKHFPGYGSNKDTHKTSSIDNKTLDKLKETDLLPFMEGIAVGAEAILMSHNIVKALDEKYPVSLSIQSHNVLRDDLKFTGIIITDDISMNALNNISNKTYLSVKAKNNLIITSNYEESFNEIKTNLDNGKITEQEIDELVLKNIAWKYYKGLL